MKRGRPNTVADKLEVRHRVEDLVELKVTGMTWEQVAETAGYGTAKSAKRAVTNYLKRLPAPTVDELRKIENARYDKVQMVIWARVLRGEDKAIEHFCRISAARRAMNGIDLQPQLILAPDQLYPEEPAIHVWRQQFAALPVEAKQELFRILDRYIPIPVDAEVITAPPVEPGLPPPDRPD